MAKNAGELAEGTIVGNWRIGKPLGTGGQGTVWEVRPTDVKHSPPRALKACFLTDERGRARFEREIEFLKACASPLVLAVVEAQPAWKDHVSGTPPFAYYVAERHSGALDNPKSDLGDARQRVNWFRQACHCVQHLHAQPDPVIHRDIKPSNFLIASEPRRLVIADFGIARSELAESNITATREVVGTEHFRAPETLSGRDGSVASDVYSLGRVLEWLLTEGVSNDLATRPVPRGGDLEDSACDALDRVIMKATQPVAANRYKNVSEMLAHLPDLWISLKPRAVPQISMTSPSATEVLPAAFDLARKNDRLGWWQLEQQLRRTTPDVVRRWQVEANQAVIANEDQLPPLVDLLIEAASGRFAFGLVGLLSQQAGLTDQSRLLEDLFSLPDLAGKTFATQAPRGLVYLFQHLHGALCLQLERHDLALQLATTIVPRNRRNETLPLWHAHDLVGWPELLGGTCTRPWRYLRTLRERHPFLRELFAIDADFDIGLAGYSMLMTLVEFAHEVDGISQLPNNQLMTLTLDVPPMFIEMDREVIRAAARRVFGSPKVVGDVSARFNVTHDDLRLAWPRWVTATRSYYGQVNPDFYGDWPVGDLA